MKTMEEIGNVPTIGGFSTTLFLQGEPVRHFQSPFINPDAPIHDVSIDACFQEHLHGSMILPPSLVNSNYEELDGSNKWDFNKLSGFDPIAMNLDRLRESISFNNLSLSNELSLSLATSRSSVMGSDHSFCRTMELTPSFEYHRSVQFPPLASGSRYLPIIQDILTLVASYSLENFDPVNYLSRVHDNEAFSSNVQDGYNMETMGRGRRKDHLLALLQAVDDQYNQCTDEIHTVISAFHAATELNPKIHAQFALQTISILYKNLRERISNCILAMGEDSIDQERRWSVQHMKRKDHLHHHQLWRVQRGLPEKSVSVLRTWMFDNFLHPYPKDAEKHLLALKSGLSRNQVSNWFINARVRLWKPMIEEMYGEINRRKGISGVVVEGTNVGLNQGNKKGNNRNSF